MDNSSMSDRITSDRIMNNTMVGDGNSVKGHHDLESDSPLHFIPEFIYASVDGTITTFNIVASAVGADLGIKVILILGIASLIGDGLSMAIGKYLSVKSEEELGKDIHYGPVTWAVGTFLSFAVIGAIPLICFILAYMYRDANGYVFYIAYLFTALTFFLIGAIKNMALRKNPVKGGLQVLTFGGIGAIISYSIGVWLKNIKI